MHILQMQPL
ncbi:hypothetical protein BOH78_3508 [Pichia kudriavzevii]|uniref:Uncharacterized protein n=1 Tax=Pichia kudriavzevii TaxID=4909 RepID=A0A1V2LJG0_PICKU|nr:hypothetical protein BOH78_3508 [Pichia kudriavzevii]